MAPQTDTARAAAARPSPAPLRTRNGFAVDPVTDGAIVGVALGFGALSQFVLGTGELVPQQPQSPDRLLALDRVALHVEDKSAGPLSTIVVGAGLAYAIVDPIVSAVRIDRRAILADFTLYAETLSLTLAATNLAKLTVRRPRPSAYIKQEELNEQFGADAPNITETDSGMSFFSGHTAMMASVTSTATYLAFVRAGVRSPRPWLTLGIGTAMTTFVAIERVRAAAHFPTDVIAGAMAGAGIGLLVPHLHRFDASRERLVWVGAFPLPGGGSVDVSGTF